ncbi:MAG: hypothetical protein R3F43_14235 [bacterium]
MAAGLDGALSGLPPADPPAPTWPSSASSPSPPPLLLRDLTGDPGSSAFSRRRFVVGAVVFLFAGHRGLTLDRPRFFSDWA